MPAPPLGAGAGDGLADGGNLRSAVAAHIELMDSAQQWAFLLSVRISTSAWLVAALSKKLQPKLVYAINWPHAYAIDVQALHKSTNTSFIWWPAKFESRHLPLHPAA